MSDIWFTSDTHFGHSNIITYCSRPFRDAEEMDATLIANWNKRVSPRDTVYHLGDIWLTNKLRASSIHAQLNGSITLIRGNHDRHSRSFYESLGIMVEKQLVIDLARHGAPGESVALVHDLSWWQKNQRSDSFRVDRVFCGHAHEKWRVRMLTRPAPYVPIAAHNVGVDVRGFGPVTYEEVLHQDREL